MRIYSSNITLKFIYLFLIILYLQCNNLQHCYTCNPLSSIRNLLSSGSHANNSFSFIMFILYCILLDGYPVAKINNNYYAHYFRPFFLISIASSFSCFLSYFSVLLLKFFIEVNFLKSLNVSQQRLSHCFCVLAEDFAFSFPSISVLCRRSCCKKMVADLQFKAGSTKLQSTQHLPYIFCSFLINWIYFF